MKRHSNKLALSAGRQAWVGVNFWSRAGGPRMWRDYDSTVVADELAQLRAHGITVTRSFLFWPDFHPEPDRLDSDALANLADFLRLHTDAGMHTIPTFIVGHMSGANWDPVWRNGRDLLTDVWFVGRQAWYVREVVKLFADHSAIAGWLLTNEMPIYVDGADRGVGTVDHNTVTAWAQILIDAIRAGGGRQPVSIGEGAWGVEVTGRDNGFRIRELVPLVDFLGPHVYRMEDDQVRQNLGAAFICELLDFGDKPVIMEEFGVTSDFVDEENAAHYYRQTLHNTLLAGATGWLPWNNVDYDELHDQAPYTHHPFEMHFGLIDQYGRPKAQLQEVKKFAELLDDIEFSRLSRPDVHAAILVSSYLEAQHPLTNPDDAAVIFDTARQGYIAAREADLPIGVVRESDGIPGDLDLIIVPSTKALLSTTWARLMERATGGATVYASYFSGEHLEQRGAWWPKLDEMFGVRKRLSYGLVTPIEDRTVEVTFLVDFGEIARGTTLEFAVGGVANGRTLLHVDATDAEVIAVDAQGRPALLRRAVGTGQMVLATYPFEYLAASVPRVNPEPTWSIYAALAIESEIERLVSVPDPRVLTALQNRDDGERFVWFINQSAEAVSASIESSREVRDRTTRASLTTIELPPYEVVVAQLTSDPAHSEP